MKLVAGLGSTRKDSVSRKIAEEVMRGVESKGGKTVVFAEDKMSVKGCTGCGACKRQNSDCVIDDDMQAYYQELHDCDALLVAAPNYYSQVAGHMITFMNRHFCLMTAQKVSRLEPGIKLVGVFAQGAPVGVEQYMRNYDWYLNTFTYYGMEVAGSLVAGGNSDLGPTGEIMTKAFALGQSL